MQGYLNSHPWTISAKKSCKLFATRKPTSSQQNEISAPTLQRVLCKGVLCVHFHFKDILLHSSFATAKTFSLRFVQGFLSAEAKLPFSISRVRSWDKPSRWPLPSEKGEEEEGTTVVQSSGGWSLGSQTSHCPEDTAAFQPQG